MALTKKVSDFFSKVSRPKNFADSFRKIWCQCPEPTGVKVFTDGSCRANHAAVGGYGKCDCGKYLKIIRVPVMRETLEKTLVDSNLIEMKAINLIPRHLLKIFPSLKDFSLFTDSMKAVTHFNKGEEEDGSLLSPLFNSELQQFLTFKSGCRSLYLAKADGQPISLAHSAARYGVVSTANLIFKREVYNVWVRQCSTECLGENPCCFAVLHLDFEELEFSNQYKIFVFFQSDEAKVFKDFLKELSKKHQGKLDAVELATKRTLSFCLYDVAKEAVPKLMSKVGELPRQPNLYVASDLEFLTPGNLFDMKLPLQSILKMDTCQKRDSGVQLVFQVNDGSCKTITIGIKDIEGTRVNVISVTKNIPFAKIFNGEPTTFLAERVGFMNDYNHTIEVEVLVE